MNRRPRQTLDRSNRRVYEENTHALYLYEPFVELAERLLASMLPEAVLGSMMLVNSGS